MAQRILVVDDDKNMLKMLEMFLTREGYRVDTAEGISGAAEAVGSNDYCIIVVDNTKSGIDGNPEGDLELLRRVRSMSLFSPVIVITGNPIVEAHDTTSKIDAACFISKPFSLAEFRQKIEALVAGQAERGGRG